MSLETLRRRLAELNRGEVRAPRRTPRRLEEAVPGRELATAAGPCYLAEQPVPDLAFPSIRSSLPEQLRLVRGIGRATERRLRDDGVRAIADLAAQPRYAGRADAVLAALASGEYATFAGRVPDLLFLGQFAPREIAVVDIETTGLTYTPLFLIGVLSFGPDGGAIRQYLARSYDEEAAALEAASHDLAAFRCLVTYNGRAFDLPYIEARQTANGLRPLWRGVHVDALPHARRRFRGILPNCRLTTVERHVLGRPRQDDIEGWMIPQHYHEFARTGHARYIAPIVRHNAADLVAVARLLPLLIE